MNQVREDIHSRNPLLFFAAVMCFSRGLAYTFADRVKADLPDGLSKLNSFVPIWIYGALWMLAGVGVIWLALSRVQSYLVMAFTALPAFIWAIAYLIGWIGQHNSFWIAAALYWTASGLVFWAGMTTPKRGWRG